MLSVGSLRFLSEEQDVLIGHIRVMAIRDGKIRRRPRYDDVQDGASGGGVLEAMEGSSCEFVIRGHTDGRCW